MQRHRRRPRSALDDNPVVKRGAAGSLALVCCQSYPVGPRGVAIAPAVFPTRSQSPRQPHACLPLQTPGCAEAFYRGASEPATGGTDASGPVDFAPVREAADEIVHLAFISMNLLNPASAASLKVMWTRSPSSARSRLMSSSVLLTGAIGRGRRSTSNPRSASCSSGSSGWRQRHASGSAAGDCPRSTGRAGIPARTSLRHRGRDQRGNRARGRT